MGQSSSSGLLEDNRYLEQFVSSKSYPFNDPFWKDLLSFKIPLNVLDSEEVEKTIRSLCSRLVTNNRLTANFQTLCEHMIERLRAAPSDQHPNLIECVNTVFLVRIFAKHLVESQEHTDLCAHFGIEYPRPVSDQSANPPLPLAHRMADIMFDFLIAADVTPENYMLHVELLTLILVVSATQLFVPLSPPVPHLFLDIFIGIDSGGVDHQSRHRLVNDKAASLVRALLIDIIEKKKGPKPPQTAGVVKTLATAATTMLLLPYYAYTYFFPSHVDKGSGSATADKSLMVLLVLSHYRPDPNVNNPFRTALRSFIDSYFDSSDPESSAVGSSVVKVPFGQLFDTIGPYMKDELTTLLAYCVLHGNGLFLQYALARTDLDTLVVPILQMLYTSNERKSNQIYMLLIILLILSQDTSFNSAVHTINIAAVPWFRDRLLSDISLGSLTVVVLVRVLQENLTRVQDTYLHRNCLAVLANMAPHFQNLHSYAAQRLVVLFQLLSQRHAKLLQRLHALTNTPQNGGNSSQDQDALEDTKYQYEVYSEFLRTILETINACLTFALPRNPNLLYVLLQKSQIFSAHRNYPSFVDIVENIEAVTRFLTQKLDEANLPLPWSIPQVLAVIEQSTRAWKNDKFKVNLRGFTYEEDARPEEFFVPYIWTLVFHNAGVPWDSSKIVLFSLNQSEFGDSEGDPDAGVDAQQMYINESEPQSEDPSPHDSFQRFDRVPLQ